jgi:hypothetical protein
MTRILDPSILWTVALAARRRRPRRVSPVDVDLPDGPLSRFLFDLLVHPEKVSDRIWGAFTEWLGSIAPLAIGTSWAWWPRRLSP